MRSRTTDMRMLPNGAEKRDKRPFESRPQEAGKGHGDAGNPYPADTTWRSEERERNRSASPEKRATRYGAAPSS